MDQKKFHEQQRLIREQELDDKAEKVSNKVIKYLVMGSLIALILTVVIGFFRIKHNLSPFNRQDPTTVEVTIPVGSNSADIADLLEEHHLIRDALTFNYFLKFNNKEALQAGHYQFNQAMDAEQLLATLQKGGSPIHADADKKITVIEGMQLEEIAQLIGQETAITAEEFMKIANDKAVISRLINQFPSLLKGILDYQSVRYPLEGYLHPATYDYNAGMSAEELIAKMVGATNEMYQHLLPELEQQSLTFHQVLTFASIVEREAVTEEDRKLVAGVFFNRLANQMPFQSDITILYALNEHKEFVTYKDLEVDSPYNTYQHAELPPGPINSPSLMAIQAVIYPEPSDYLFFVADLDTGKVYYSSTLEEHDKLVEQYVNSREAERRKEASQAQESVEQGNQ